MKFKLSSIALASLTFLGINGAIAADIPDIPEKPTVTANTPSYTGSATLSKGQTGVLYAPKNCTAGETPSLIYGAAAENNGDIWVVGGGDHGTYGEGLGSLYDMAATSSTNTATNNGNIYVISDGKTQIKAMGSNPSVKAINNGNIVVSGEAYGMVINSGDNDHSAVNSSTGTITVSNGGTGFYLGHNLTVSSIEMKNEGTIQADGEGSKGVVLEGEVTYNKGKNVATFENSGTIAAINGAQAVSINAGTFKFSMSGESNIDGTFNIADDATVSLSANGVTDEFTLEASKLEALELSDGANLTLSAGQSKDLSIKDVTISKDSSVSFTDDRNIEITASATGVGNFKNEGNFSAKTLTVTKENNSFSNSGTIDVGTLDLSGSANDKSAIGGIIKASDRITYRGIAGNLLTRKLDAILYTPLLQIQSDHTNWSGFLVTSNDVLANVQNIEITSAALTQGSTRTGLTFEGDDIVVNSNIAFKGDGSDARIEIKNGSNVTLSNVSSTAAGSKIQINGSATATVDSISVDQGAALSLQVNGSTEGDNAVFSLSQISVADGGAFRASVYDDKQPDITIQGDIDIRLGENSIVDFGGQKNPDWRDQKIHIESSSINIAVSDSDNAGTVYLSKSGTDLAKTQIIVTSDASNNTGNAQSDLEKLTNVVQLTSKTGYTADDTTNYEVAEGTSLNVAASDIYDGASGVLTTNEAGEASVSNIKTTSNANVYGVAQMAVTGLNIWRNEINDMNKRLGELRDSSAHDNGLWARVYQNRSEYGSLGVEGKHTAVQLGYDRQLLSAQDSRSWLGAAFSYTDIDSEFDSGSGEGNLYALTVYGSWLHDNGAFLDLTAKIGRMKNEFTTWQNSTVSTGDYHANAYSVSAEAGWRFYPVKDVLFVEPQAEMMFGYVDSADYTTSSGIKVEQDSTQAVIGRIGFAAGFKYPNNLGNIYVRASLLHDFDGDVDYRFISSNGGSRQLSEDIGGTWYEYGVGANFNFTDNMHGYVDLERQSGGEVVEDWRWNVGVRYSF